MKRLFGAVGSMMFRNILLQFLGLGVCILLLGGAFYGLERLYFAPSRVPPCQQKDLPEGRICPQELMDHWRDARDPSHYKVVWVDARSESDYELNHLLGQGDRIFPIRPGTDLPRLMDAAIERLIRAEQNGECIVVFCTASCTSSSEVADELRRTGLISAPIFVLEGGWSSLQEMPYLQD